MNDEWQMTDEQLRRATARPAPSGDDLDGETAALREGFLSLGKLCEEVANRGDDGALVARLEGWARLQEASSPPVALAAKGKERKWQVLLGGALVLSILLVAAQILRQWPSGGMVAAPGLAKVANDRAPLVGEQASLPGASAKARSIDQGERTNVFYSAIAWPDALDYEIASAEADVRRLGSSQRGLDGSLNQMNDRLQALSRELWTERL
jgi:hypothetical protein